MNRCKCPNCESKRFENTDLNVDGVKHVLNAIMCKECKSIIHVTNLFELDQLLKIAKKVGV